MFKYSAYEHSGVLHLTQVGRSTFEDFQAEMPGIIRCLRSGKLHLTQVGRSTFEDFQAEMPGIIRCLRSGKYPKLLLEIKHLDEPENYIDPDLAFGAINQIKSLISRMAIVCPADVYETVVPVAEIVRNYRKPVKKFSRVTDALRWLEQER